jgi:hypothetical protein
MKKLRALSFRSLPNAAHFGFCTHVSDVLSKAGAALLTALDDLPAQFNAWLNREWAQMEWLRKSAITAQIAEANRRIDRALVALGTQVRALEYSPAPNIAEAAHKLHLMLKNYGNVYNKPYDEAEGDVRIILAQLTDAYAPDITLLGLDAHVVELQAALTEFRQLVTQRQVQSLQKPAETFVAVRRGIEAVYHSIVARVNAGAILNASPDFAAFVDALNPHIDHLNNEFHRVRHDIAAAAPAPIPPQRYTGEPLTPIPDVYYDTPKHGTRKLSLGKDYNLTYKHNKNVGNAECAIRGKGAYKGHITITFNIEGEQKAWI